MNFSTGWPRQIVRGVSRWTARLMPAAPALDDFPFMRSDVALYHRTVVDGEGGKNARLMVDEQTWSDMLLDQYSAQLATQTSIFGQQMLHHRLRGEAADADSIDRVRTLAHDAPRLARLTRAGEQLRRATSEVGALLCASELDAADLPAGVRCRAGAGMVAVVVRRDRRLAGFDDGAGALVRKRAAMGSFAAHLTASAAHP